MEADIAKLRSIVTKLEIAHDKKVEDFKKEFPAIDPYDVTDTTGRPILLDSLVAITNANAALAQVEFYLKTPKRPRASNRLTY
jgi:hypothetical protein